MIRIDDDLYHLDAIDIEAVSAVVIQQDAQEALVSSRKLQALVALCHHVAKRSNRVKRSLLLEFTEESERVGLRRAG